MHPIRILILIIFIASTLFVSASAGSPPPPTPASPAERAELSVALAGRRQAASESAAPLASTLFTPELDSAFIAPGGETAVLWLALRDNSGRLLASEPGLALARRTSAGWQVLLPGDPGWEETLASLPAGMLPLEQSPAPETPEGLPGIPAGSPGENLAPASSTSAGALTGYYLPYAAGTARRLEGSISHFMNIPALGWPSCTMAECRYAYDFTDAGHFPVLASRDGTVYATRDTCSDGDPNCTNYVLLRDTSGASYQVYLHFSHGTIPDKLTSGKTVRRGQYLGDTDDTGYSTSNHVHFMVVTAASLYFGGDGYPWGTSVDIRFADVSINSGTPRTCYEVTQLPIYSNATQCLGNKADPLNASNDWFISGNTGAYPPTGSLSRPAAGATLGVGNDPWMDVTASASDDVAVTAVRLLAKLNGQWVEVGPKVTQPSSPGVYDWDVNLCAVGPLNGPLDVALRLWDYEGNVTGPLAARTVQVDNACPPPASQLNPAETFDSTAVHLGWDVTNPGIGVSSFELQWRSEPGTWQDANTFSFPASQRSIWFVGQPGVTYGFRLAAFDTNNQAEPWLAGDAPEITVSLPAACTPDPAEPDDVLNDAKALVPGEWALRNLCSPANPDWFQVSAAAAGAYMVTAQSQGGGAAVTITVYDGTGATALAMAQSSEVGQGARAFFRAPAAGIYYVKVEPLPANLSGSAATYGLLLSETKDIFIPLVER